MDCKIFMWIVKKITWIVRFWCGLQDFFVDCKIFMWIVRFLCGLLDFYVDCKDLKGRKFVLLSTNEYIGDISLWRAIVVVIVWYKCSWILQLLTQLLPINLNPAHGGVYSIQHYVIKFVSDLRQVGGFLGVLQFPPPKKLTATI